MQRVLVLTVSALLGSAAAAWAQPADLSGTWRLDGADRQGPYTEVIRFQEQAGGRYHYERGQDLDGGARVEEGDAEIVGRRLFTREELNADRDGLLATLGGGALDFDPPRRHGYYRVESTQEIEGWFFVPGRYSHGRERLTRFDGRNNNHVELLVDGEQFFPELRRAIEGAQRSVSLQTFIYTEDSTGRRIARLLMDKAREGVEVRVLTDAVNSDISRGLRNDLRDAGVELIIAHTWTQSIAGSVRNVGSGLWSGIKRLFGAKPKPREKRGIFNHDHRKITIVDGRVGFIGGMNIAKEYESEWHDVQARVEGRAVSEFEDLFFDRWWAAGGEGEIPLHDAALDSPTYRPGHMSVDVVTTLPGVNYDIKHRYLEEIDAARDRISIECAYFLDDDVISSLKRQAGRGVDAVVIVPNDPKHDVKIVRDGFNWVQNDVVRSGIRLYKYRGPMVHSKVAAFDGRVCTVGSSNLDNIALEKLAEANVFVNEPSFTREMERRVFDVDIPQSDRVGVEKMSWWKRVKGGVLHFLRSFL